MYLRSVLYPAAASCALVAASAAHVHAQDNPTEFAPLVVTATRTAQTVDETLATVDVITADDIRAAQYQSLPQALESVPGVQISRSGGTGKQTRISIRGTDPKHALVLIDGIRQSSATSGEAALQHLPLSQIERIEVVRGPRSTLYGSDAVGGVIQIFTRRGTGDMQGEIRAGLGSNHSNQVQTFVAGTSGSVDYSFSAAHERTAGFDARQNAVPGAWGPTPEEPDEDGYKQQSLSFQLGHQFAAGNRIAVHGLRSAGENEFDGAPNSAESLQQNMGIRVDLAPVDRLELSLNLGQSRDELDNENDQSSFSHFHTRSNQGALQANWYQGPNGLLSLGMDYRDDEIGSNIEYDQSSRDNTGYFAQYQWSTGKQDILAGVRLDDNEQFGSQSTYNLGYAYQLPASMRLSLNFGTAFRAPTFNELYWPADPVFGGGGNPDLQPEESQSYEAALEQRQAEWHWKIGAFRTDIDQLISGWPAQNIDEARIDGLELEAGYRFSQHWSTNLSATFQDPRDENTDNILPRRARRTASLSLDADYGPLQSRLQIQGVSKRFDDPDNQTRLPGYALLNLSAQYALGRGWSVEGRVDNLLDKQYQEVATYNTAGREGWLHLSYRF